MELSKIVHGPLPNLSKLTMNADGIGPTAETEPAVSDQKVAVSSSRMRSTGANQTPGLDRVVDFEGKHASISQDSQGCQLLQHGTNSSKLSPYQYRLPPVSSLLPPQSFGHPTYNSNSLRSGHGLQIRQPFTSQAHHPYYQGYVPRSCAPFLSFHHGYQQMRGAPAPHARTAHMVESNYYNRSAMPGQQNPMQGILYQRAVSSAVGWNPYPYSASGNDGTFPPNPSSAPTPEEVTHVQHDASRNLLRADLSSSQVPEATHLNPPNIISRPSQVVGVRHDHRRVCGKLSYQTGRINKSRTQQISANGELPIREHKSAILKSHESVVRSKAKKLRYVSIGRRIAQQVRKNSSGACGRKSMNDKCTAINLSSQEGAISKSNETRKCERKETKSSDPGISAWGLSDMKRPHAGQKPSAGSIATEMKGEDLNIQQKIEGSEDLGFDTRPACVSPKQGTETRRYDLAEISRRGFRVFRGRIYNKSNLTVCGAPTFRKGKCCGNVISERCHQHGSFAEVTNANSFNGKLDPHGSFRSKLLGETDADDDHVTDSTENAITDLDELPKKAPRKLRWRDDEHCAFLILLREHGSSWKRIASQMGSRTTLQVQSHGQKFHERRRKSEKKKGSIHDFTLDSEYMKRLEDKFKCQRQQGKSYEEILSEKLVDDGI